ncbi:MAG: hypothetical protein RMJ35_04125 [Phycisphaerales bacterium]|nr:hypothetical protein [Phycisphaerales bacterium]
MPRYGTGAPDNPFWEVNITNLLVGQGKWNWDDMKNVRVLQCTAHPDEEVPTGFTLNAFAFESQPRWRGSPAMQTSLIPSPASLPWLLEIPDKFLTTDCNGIYCPEWHVAYAPRHLPGGKSGSCFVLAPGAQGECPLL